MNNTPEPSLGNYTVIFNHYAKIPMRYGRLITDTPSLLRTRDGALLCAVPFIVNHQGNKGLPKDPAFRPLLFFRSADDGRTWQRLDASIDFCCGLLIDGDDLLVAARTSRNGAHQHDNDLTTFQRVRNFRERAAFLLEWKVP